MTGEKSQLCLISYKKHRTRGRLREFQRRGPRHAGQRSAHPFTHTLKPSKALTTPLDAATWNGSVWTRAWFPSCVVSEFALPLGNTKDTCRWTGNFAPLCAGWVASDGG